MSNSANLWTAAPQAPLSTGFSRQEYWSAISFSYLFLPFISQFQFSSVPRLCPIHCDPMDCSIPGLPVHHQLLEFTQTHVHWVSDAIQPSHPLSSPSPPALNVSQHQGLFKWIGSSNQSAKVLDFQLQHQCFQWIFMTDWDWLVWPPCCPRDSQESSPTPQFKSINSLVLNLLNGSTLTSTHDYWKKHSFDYTDICWQSNVSAV